MQLCYSCTSGTEDMKWLSIQKKVALIGTTSVHHSYMLQEPFEPSCLSSSFNNSQLIEFDHLDRQFCLQLNLDGAPMESFKLITNLSKRLQESQGVTVTLTWLFLYITEASLQLQFVMRFAILVPCFKNTDIMKKKTPLMLHLRSLAKETSAFDTFSGYS